MESLRSDTMRVVDHKRNLKIAISLIYYLVRAIFHVSLRLLGRPRRQRLTILYYHGVTRDSRPSFARQMQALYRGAIVLPASYRGQLAADKNRKFVAITFDDAFISVAENGLPELEKYSFHSTIFVPVGWLGQTPGWALETSEVGSAEPQELSEVVMSSDQLQGLNRASVSLGSHTLTHPSLPDIESEQAREEVERSRLLLAELTGRDISELSFPYGAHSEPTVALCRAALYKTVYSIIPEEVDTTTDELLRGRTKTDPSDGPLEFFLKFSGAYEWMAYSGALKRALRSMFSATRTERERALG
jgi:peptidoglycan/xylan/chitin deacetylase (PgdA/CDA1 family)